MYFGQMDRHCINYGITTALIKERKRWYIWLNKERRDGGEWLIKAHTQNIPYLSIVTTQDRKKVRKGPIDEGKGA